MQNSHDDFFGGDASRKLSSIMVPVSGTLLSGIRGVLSRFHDCGIRYRQVACIPESGRQKQKSRANMCFHGLSVSFLTDEGSLIVTVIH